MHQPQCTIQMLDSQRLKQSGFETLGDLVRAYTDGVLASKQLVQPFADELTNSIVVKLSTMDCTANANIPQTERARWDLNPRSLP